MPRFFLSSEMIRPDHFVLTGENARHISGALRMKTGERIVVCDGRGTDYRCVIDHLSPDRVSATVEETYQNTSEATVTIELYVGLSKGDKMEGVIKKAVELGVCAIQPFLSERCISRPDGKNAEAKFVRYRKISEEAAKQSGRGAIPAVHPVVPFEEAVKKAALSDISLFLYEEARDVSLRQALSEKTGRRYALMTGPEGGFSPEEAACAEKAGVTPVTLGPRILRCETAPLAAMTMILYQTGNFEYQDRM